MTPFIMSMLRHIALLLAFRAQLQNCNLCTDCTLVMSILNFEDNACDEIIPRGVDRTDLWAAQFKWEHGISGIPYIMVMVMNPANSTECPPEFPEQISWIKNVVYEPKSKYIQHQGLVIAENLETSMIRHFDIHQYYVMLYNVSRPPSTSPEEIQSMIQSGQKFDTVLQVLGVDSISDLRAWFKFRFTEDLSLRPKATEARKSSSSSCTRTASHARVGTTWLSGVLVTVFICIM